MLLARQKQEMLDAELKEGEKLLWAGQPNPIRAAQQFGSAGPFVCGVAWTTLTIFFLNSWWQDVKSGTSGLSEGALGLGVGIALFSLIGIGLLAWPYSVFVRAASTVYGITDTRVVIMEGGERDQIESYGRAELGTIESRERADGTGDLTFAQKPHSEEDGRIFTTDLQLIGIPEVREVEVLLLKALTLSR